MQQGHRYIRAILTLAFVLLYASSVFSQDAGIKLVVKLKHKNDPYPGCIVKIYKNGSFLDQSQPDESARFTYTFAYNHTYMVEFTGPGMATKKLEIDLKNTPEHEMGVLHEWEIGELSLFKAYDGLDITQLNKPVGRIHYDEESYDFTIDYKYGASVEKQLNALEKKVNVEEKNEAIAIKDRQSIYNDFIAQGDELFKTEKYEDALFKYKEARQLIPTNTKAQEKIEKTNGILESEKMYSNLVVSGDYFFRSEDYHQAKEKYQMALDLKPNESYPKSQLALLSEKIEQQALDANQFNNYMSVADNAYEKGNMQVAKQNYRKALAVNPGAALAKRKLELIEADEAQKAAQLAMKQNQFDSLLQVARTQSEQKNFAGARQSLSAAAVLYPYDQNLRNERAYVKEAEADYEAQQAKLAVQNQKKAEFEELKKKGMEADQKGDKKTALFYYNKALTYQPNDLVIKSRVRLLSVPATSTTAAQKPSSSSQDASDMAQLDKMDKKSEGFVAMLASQYPQGVTERTYKDGNKTVTKRIVVKGSRGTEYMKVLHSWGGVYYFKNGEPTSQTVWDKETRK